MSHSAEAKASGSPQFLDAIALRRKPFWNVRETAFMTGVSVRTVWRLVSDPNSGFPKPRHVRGRTLLSGAEVLAWMDSSIARAT